MRYRGGMGSIGVVAKKKTGLGKTGVLGVHGYGDRRNATKFMRAGQREGKKKPAAGGGELSTGEVNESLGGGTGN